MGFKTSCSAQQRPPDSGRQLNTSPPAVAQRRAAGAAGGEELGLLLGYALQIGIVSLVISRVMKKVKNLTVHQQVAAGTEAGEQLRQN